MCRAWFYVDDMVLTGSDSTGIQEVISALSAVFDIKDLGHLTFFLGLHVHKVNKGLFVNQSKYTRDLLVRTCMDSAKPCNTPCLPHTQLSKDQGNALSDPTLYMSIVGALQYLTFTMPDITYDVNTVSIYDSTY